MKDITAILARIFAAFFPAVAAVLFAVAALPATYGSDYLEQTEQCEWDKVLCQILGEPRNKTSGKSLEKWLEGWPALPATYGSDYLEQTEQCEWDKVPRQILCEPRNKMSGKSLEKWLEEWQQRRTIPRIDALPLEKRLELRRQQRQESEEKERLCNLGSSDSVLLVILAHVIRAIRC